MGKMDQKVLCIATTKLFTGEHPKWDGLQTKDLPDYLDLLIKESEFRVRGELEEDPSYKQIIPQVILRHQGKYFLHRQVNANEQRLNSMCPLPLGGHVEEFDLNDDGNLIETALERELTEEADVKSPIVNKELLGLIYIEDENPVNHVHIGLVYIFDLDGEDVKIREEGLENIGFVDLEYLEENITNLTYWSRVIVKHLAGKG